MHQVELQPQNASFISKMSNVLEKGEMYAYESALEGWTKVMLMDFDDDCVFVRLLDKQSYWRYDREAIMRREVFEKNYRKVD